MRRVRLALGKIRLAFRRMRFEHWVLLLVVTAATTTTSVIGLSTLHQSHEGAVAKEVLCAQRVALDKQIKRTETFLAKNPKGIPGISPALIRAGLQDDIDQRTTSARLHCPEGK